ncbi:hypothetical protein Tco_0763857 [Tanacetum coccineum]
MFYSWHGLRKGQRWQCGAQWPSMRAALPPFIVVVGCYLASDPQEEDHQYIVAILGLIVPLIIVAIGVEAFWKK